MDENIHRAVVEYFANKMEVISVAKKCRGCPDEPDEDVVKLSSKLKAILVTRDNDFGNTIFTSKAKCHSVILLRISSVIPSDTIDAIEHVIERVKIFEDKFVVATDKSIRIREFQSK